MRVPIRVVTKDFSQFNLTDIMRGRVRAELELVFGSEPLGSGLLCLLDLGVVDTEKLPLTVQHAALAAPVEDIEVEDEPEWPDDQEHPDPVVEAQLAPLGRKKDGTPRKAPGPRRGGKIDTAAALDALDRQPVG